jgi:hypothetical protein
LRESIVCELGLAHGLVDNKVCAVDDVWSGLRFVYRLKDRPVSSRAPLTGNVVSSRRQRHRSLVLAAGPRDGRVG